MTCPLPPAGLVATSTRTVWRSRGTCTCVEMPATYSVCFVPEHPDQITASTPSAVSEEVLRVFERIQVSDEVVQRKCIAGVPTAKGASVPLTGSWSFGLKMK